MKQRRRPIFLGTFVVALFLAACSGDIGRVGNNQWSLEGLSPDGEHLVVSTFFGGVASGCSRFDGWEVTETVESVEINARLWQRIGPSDCTDEGVTELLQIDLDQPLGDRELLGCGGNDCATSALGGGNLSVGQVIAVDTAVAIANRSGLEVHAPSGELLAEVPGSISGQVLAIRDGVVAYNDRDGSATAVDLSTGAEVWQTVGRIAATNSNTVYVCRGQDSDGLTAIDAATGASLWETDLPCESPVVHDDLVTIVANDPNVDGGHRVVVAEAATGQVVLDEAIFDGIDDQVGGFEGAVGVGPNTVTSGPQADLVVLARNGSEVGRAAIRLGIPLGEVGGVAILGSQNRLIGYDTAELSELWTVEIDAFRSVSIGSGSIWVLGEDGREISRLDSQTGEPLWTTAFGVTTSFDVDGATDTAYILTTQALIAVDNQTGASLWSVHKPYAPSN